MVGPLVFSAVFVIFSSLALNMLVRWFSTVNFDSKIDLVVRWKDDPIISGRNLRHIKQEGWKKNPCLKNISIVRDMLDFMIKYVVLFFKKQNFLFGIRYTITTKNQ